MSLEDEFHKNNKHKNKKHKNNKKVYLPNLNYLAKKK